MPHLELDDGSGSTTNAAARARRSCSRTARAATPPRGGSRSPPSRSATRSSPSTTAPSGDRPTSRTGRGAPRSGPTRSRSSTRSTLGRCTSWRTRWARARRSGSCASTPRASARSPSPARTRGASDDRLRDRKAELQASGVTAGTLLQRALPEGLPAARARAVAALPPDPLVQPAAPARLPRAAPGDAQLQGVECAPAHRVGRAAALDRRSARPRHPGRAHAHVARTHARFAVRRGFPTPATPPTSSVRPPGTPRCSRSSTRSSRGRSRVEGPAGYPRVEGAPRGVPRVEGPAGCPRVEGARGVSPRRGARGVSPRRGARGVSPRRGARGVSSSRVKGARGG